MFALEYTPYILPFVLSLIITAGLGLYAARRRHIQAATTFAFMMLAMFIWTFCYIMELSTVSLEGKIFWASAKYFGSATGPVLLFILALQLTKNERWLTPLAQFALWAFAFVTIFVVFTNEFHHWYWTSVQLVPGLPETQTEHGFYFWIYAVFSYLVVLTSAVLYFIYYRTTPALYRRQALLLALGGFVPLAGRILEDFFNVDLFPNVDNIILLFLISGILFAVAIFRYGALDVVHIAHNIVIQNIHAGIIVLDQSERIVEMNPFAQMLVDATTGSVIGKPIQVALAGFPELGVKVRGESEVSLEKGGITQFLHVTTSPIFASNNALAGYSIVLFDITRRKQAERQLELLARTDALTGVTNRRYFYELAEAQFARARRYERPLAVLMFDVDHFKKINDTYGHSVGDLALKFVATLCQQHVRATDIFARYGGEEFICLLDEIELEDARLTAERIRHALENSPLEHQGKAIALTISIGISVHTAAGPLLFAEFLKRADEALYQAKADGRNRVRVWRSEYENQRL